VFNEPPLTETSLEELATTLTNLWWHAVFLAPIPEAASRAD